MRNSSSTAIDDGAIVCYALVMWLYSILEVGFSDNCKRVTGIAWISPIDVLL